MFKKTVTYTDYNGVERTEDFYFNFTKAEMTEMELSQEGTFSEWIQKVVDSQNTPELIAIFKKIVLESYGEKSPDGRRFIKSEEIKNAFEQTEAYSEIFMELAMDAEAAGKFINGILPKDLVKGDNFAMNGEITKGTDK